MSRISRIVLVLAALAVALPAASEPLALAKAKARKKSVRKRAVAVLDFDIRDDAAQEFSQTLATFFPEQAPTGSGYVAWRAEQGVPGDALQLFAATRAAYLPAQGHHDHHETVVAWFPGGTVTPVGPPVAATDRP